MRIQLHKISATKPEECSSAQTTSDDLESSRLLVRKIIKESLLKLEEDPTTSKKSIRWELGSCWLQHLQKKENESDSKPKSTDDVKEIEPAVKGLGKQFKLLKKREKKQMEEDNHCTPDGPNTTEMNGEPSSEEKLEKLISKQALSRLKESGTGLHLKVYFVFVSVFVYVKQSKLNCYGVVETDL